MSFCGGDPINGFDSDGRLSSSFYNEAALDASALTSSTMWDGMASDTYSLGARTVNGVVQAGAIGSDMIGQSAASAFGYGADYQGYSQLYQNIYNNPSSGPTASQILGGTLQAEVNVGTFGLYGMGQGFGTAAATGDYTQAQNGSLGVLLMAGAAGNISAGIQSFNSGAFLDDVLPSEFNIAGSQGAGTLPPMGTVTVNLPPGATAAQAQQVQAYVDGANQAVNQGLLMNGRVSTTGALRSAASRAAAVERANAAAAGTPYQGQVGHVPDTTWTGTPQPFSWLDLDPTVNASIGGQANGYPIGFVPTDFQMGD
jgi:hypothetical protein